MDLKVLFVGFFLIVLVKSAEIPANHILRRLRRSDEIVSTEATATEEPLVRLCADQTPCKWGVYGESKTKKVRYSIDNNTCVCGKERICTQSDESLAMKAYIYRCIPDPSPPPQNPDVA